MDFFKVVTVEEGKKLISDKFKDWNPGAETVDILESVDRTLAKDIVSKADVPDFNRSTVDGYGIIAEDSHGATETIPSILNIVGEVDMGEDLKIKISRGEAVYIPTGGMVPEGVTGIIMIEYTEKMEDDTILIYRPISKGENMVYIGDDIRKDEIILEKGKIIDAGTIGTLAALGISNIDVYKKPKFSIISTGDEIIDIGEEITSGKIRDINSYTIHTLVEKIGGEVVSKSIIKDRYEDLRKEVEKAIELSDVVLVSGGSSVGNKDYTADVINSFAGEGVLAHGLSIKPGKPTIIGECNGKIVIGLPGHPVSSIVVFKALIESYIYEKLGNKKILPSVEAIMESNFPSSPGKETYQMIKLDEIDGKYYGKPNHGKSGMISLLSKSQGYIVIKSHEEGIDKGDKRKVFLL